jgi:hypothetical protein
MGESPGQPNVPVSDAFDPHQGWPVQQKIGDYITIVSDNTGGDVAYSATFNFNPNTGQHEEDVYYVRISPSGAAYTYTYTYTYTDPHTNSTPSATVTPTATPTATVRPTPTPRSMPTPRGRPTPRPRP